MENHSKFVLFTNKYKSTLLSCLFNIKFNLLLMIFFSKTEKKSKYRPKKQLSINRIKTTF